MLNFNSLEYFLYFVGGLSALYWLAFVLASWLIYRFQENRFIPFLQKLPPALQAIVGVMAGLITPFCSCSTIPIFLGLLESDLPKRTAMCFLIASPLVSPPAFILSLTLLGPVLTVFYLLSAITISFIGGTILASEALKQQIKDFLYFPDDQLDQFHFRAANSGALRFVLSISPALIIAAIVAVFLKQWGIPVGLIHFLQNNTGWSIPLASLIGGVLYADLTMIIPIANEALLQDLPAGVVLPFLMAASGIGIPSLILLNRIFKWSLMTVYILTVFIMINLMGFLSMGIV